MHVQALKPQGRQGFTLVEMMVALLIAMLITGAAYSAYLVQQKNYTIQEEVAVVQQNIRAGLEIMTREMRMAGYDPSFSGNYRITAASAGSISFTSDLCEDGGPPGVCVIRGESLTETYRYELYKPANAPADYPFSLRRTPAGAAVAENIEHLEFLYTLRDGTRTSAPANAQLKQIVQVDISLLARSARKDHRHVDGKSYETASGTVLPPFNDNYHRRMATTTLQLRNLGYGS